ncbi:energy-coupling factor transporter ATPase [Desulfofalx alkaliphila]|uniref:energy-coupling factor transporter ATPase n=1 Tax=Desulfofalx alkaliphila TaxID=105483 RepID=UPI0004E22203|nr:energy-coupling factor transporter ATPase [Desulfofalx alkaliphila]
MDANKDKILIELKDVCFKYQVGKDRYVSALRNINLSIKQGQFITVTGGNGSGKSTLAKHLNGLLTPSSGKVLVQGMDSSNEKNIWEIRRRTGMVFQNPDNQLVSSILEEDVAFGLENLGLAPEDIKRKVDYYIKLLKLDHMRKHPPHLLSGGQKQRLAIAGVLAMEPDCLVLDEPSAMLDPLGRQELSEIIIQLNKRHKKTVVLVTHLMDEVALSDRVIVLQRGRIVADTTPRQLFSMGEEIKNYRLELPDVVKFAQGLSAGGFKMDRPPLNIEELVDGLCGQ